MSDWYDDARLTYAEADATVSAYIEAVAATRTQTTSVDVLTWSDTENSHHNRTRVYDALCGVADPTDDNWAGRTVFKLPDDTKQL